MSNEVKSAIAFVAGAAIGATAAWFFVKNKYAALAQEEIDSVKTAFANRFGDHYVEPTVEADESESDNDIPAKKEENRFAAVSSLNAFEAPEVEMTDYSAVTSSLGYSGDVIDKPDEADKPYVISQNECGEFGDYMEISLTYYEDGIVADDDDEIIEDVLGTLGPDFQNEFEDDVVLIRNDARKCDYEVVRDYRTYHEVTGR